MMQRMNPFQLMNAFKNAQNPQALLQNVMQNNPRLQQMMTQLQNSGGGQSAEQMAKQLAKQNGISEQDLMSIYNSINKK